MATKQTPPVLRLRGVRQNNLKGFDLDLPLGWLIVITGLSGSGKSSLAFDTLYAEGQRRYIETFSPYARQFFDRMDKPAVDRIEGIPPAIALEQRNSVRTTRSTIGTMTEICDHLKVLWPHLAQLHCRKCGAAVRKDSPAQIWEAVNTERGARSAEPGKDPVGAAEVLITFDVPVSERLGLAESLALIGKQGYQRLLVEGHAVRLEELSASVDSSRIGASLTVIQDRLKLSRAHRARFVEACEQAYHFGKGKLAVHLFTDSKLKTQNSKPFSSRLHCAACDLEYREPTPALFSFNHPLGACPNCKGFGRVITIDYHRALPDRAKSLAGGVVKPWQTATGAECQTDLLKTCKKRGVPTGIPFAQLPDEQQRWIIEGDPGYQHGDPAHSWPRAWYGVKGYFRWLESKAYKMHVRVLLSRYRAYSRCPACDGQRFNADSLLYRVRNAECGMRNGKASLTLADFYALPVRDALAFIEALSAARHAALRTARSALTDPVALALAEVRTRLAYLAEVGLGYLTLDRPTRTLSGGETERVNLTTCLGTRLVNTLFVLDEPSVGLHPRDTERLVKILQRLRDTGNTVVVVEHEAAVMRAADQIVDLGPGHGESGGELVFQGSFAKLLRARGTLTGEYLSGRREIEIPARRPVPSLRTPHSTLRISNATLHNLCDLSVEIPLGRFVCLSGVSGSGKSTLAREILFPLLDARLKEKSSGASSADAPVSAATNPQADGEETAAHEVLTTARLDGWQSLGRVLLVDQSSLGRTPRSNPAVYVGAFDHLREVFAATSLAKQRGLNASAFSFNSAAGQCGRCRGAGFEKIEMQFLSDVFIRCPECHGRRYRGHILEVKVSGSGFRVSSSPVASAITNPKPETRNPKPPAWSIADTLEATVDEAIAFLGGFGDSRHAARAAEKLRLLQDVGLGYLRLGQPINTLSGGESQRLKLVAHLAEHGVGGANSGSPSTANGSQSLLTSAATLFIFDEPTTGLHFDDVATLLKVFHRLVGAGHSLIVIEHNLDVIKSADWVIDLGPGAGDEGGRLVAAGHPEDVALCAASHTGRFLAEALRD
ncbi:MAG: excinuclease ABC subunit UvrA [Verrucomicrobia bacterium]|nr:excinuclease ABC subunit UvrA [Verrucomicrobiota bacterium]